jgi:hypothetical protein
VVFLAPATTTAQALELARKSSALKVRTQVVIRWVLWLTRPGGPSSRWAMTGLLPVQRDERMLHILRTGPEEVVPEELLAGAVHARTEAEAQAMAEAFEHVPPWVPPRRRRPRAVLPGMALDFTRCCRCCRLIRLRGAPRSPDVCAVLTRRRPWN